jgi:hypothetical protein
MRVDDNGGASRRRVWGILLARFAAKSPMAQRRQQLEVGTEFSNNHAQRYLKPAE